MPFVLLNGLSVGHYLRRILEFETLETYLEGQGQMGGLNFDYFIARLVLKYGWGEWTQISDDKVWAAFTQLDAEDMQMTCMADIYY